MARSEKPATLPAVGPAETFARETAAPGDKIDGGPDDNKDGNKEAFSQACQMYRHFVTMKYYTVAGFGVATAALATLYFVQLPATANAQTAGVWIKFCAVLVAVACGAYDWRMTDVMYYYERLIETFAVALRAPSFAQPPGTSDWMWPLRVATVLIYGGAAAAWIFFASMPHPPGQQ